MFITVAPEPESFRVLPPRGDISADRGDLLYTSSHYKESEPTGDLKIKVIQVLIPAMAIINNRRKDRFEFWR